MWKSRLALARLSEMDHQFYEDLVGLEGLCFWFDKRNLIDERLSGTHSITEDLFAWKEHGIIVVLVHAYFVTKGLGRKAFSKTDTLQLHTEVRLATQRWLSKHAFPRELCEPFNTPAR